MTAAGLPQAAATPDHGLSLLRSLLREMRSVLIAYSGGVDSSLLLKVAVDELADDALAVTARSPTMAPAELEEAIATARAIGARHEIIDVDELADPAFAANQPDRCFHCKNGLYERLTALARERGPKPVTVLDGTNLSDLSGHRPGFAAVRQQGVRAPLAEAGLTKEMIRTLSRRFGLPTADKPAAPCLSSRVPYGTAITRQMLEQIGRAEAALRGLGFIELRVRHHDEVARIEVPSAKLAAVLEQREAIVAALREAGYRFVTLDLAGLRSGSLSDHLMQPR